MPEIPTIVLILVIPAVIALVTMMKDIGLPGRLAGPVAVALGLAAMAAYTLWGDLPIFVNLMIGVLIGLGASGFYDLAKLTGIGGTNVNAIANTHTITPSPDDGHADL